jgi:hypothetical protein
VFCLSHKLIKRGHPERHFIGRWKKEDHEGHAVPLNPFSLPVHRQTVPAFQRLKGIASKYRLASLSHSEAQKLLREDSLGVRLKAKEYYNLVRLLPLDRKDPDSAIALLKALQDEGFHYRTLVREEYNDEGKMINQQLVQIVFWHPDASYLARRFCAGHLLIVDATFNTNNLRMPLITSLGITNEGTQLPVAFSYCPGETAESYTFFIKVVQQDILGEEVAQIAVLLADMAAGMISACTTHSALADGQSLQFCIFHAAEAIIARIRKGGYTSDEMDTVKALTWTYVKSETLTDLETNRQALINFIKPKEKDYINDTWQPKEQRAIRCYTRLLRNLGCAATQRLESFHNIVHQCTHGQLSLHNSAHGLAVRLKEIYRDRQEDEDNAWSTKATSLDTPAFKDLIGQVSRVAVHLIETEYLALSTEEVEYNPDCQCTNRLCYSLPCRHQLLPLQRGDHTRIPLGLIHPRWWLNGPPAPRDWQPSWGQKPLILSPKKATVYSDLAEIMAERESLSGEAQARFDRQIAQVTATMKQAAQHHRTLEVLPLGNPKEIPKRTWTRTKPTQSARALTANELGEKQQQEVLKVQAQEARDRVILQQRQQLETQDTITVVPKQVHTELQEILVPGTPLPPPEPLPPTVSEPLDESFNLPPASTAPPAIVEGRAKRARAQSGYYRAVNNGNSQEMRQKRARN